MLRKELRAMGFVAIMGLMVAGCSFLFPNPAPVPGDLSGIISDATMGDPIEGVDVIVEDKFTITNNVGKYFIQDLEKKLINSLTARKDGYEEYTATIIIDSGLNHHDISLTLIVSPSPTPTPTPTP